jgi:hypothetical protein
VLAGNEREKSKKGPPALASDLKNHTKVAAKEQWATEVCLSGILHALLLLLRFDSQLVVDRNYDHGKRRSRIVRHLWKRSPGLVAAECTR